VVLTQGVGTTQLDQVFPGFEARAVGLMGLPQV
jgi:hypothetical protein